MNYQTIKTLPPAIGPRPQYSEEFLSPRTTAMNLDEVCKYLQEVQMVRPGYRLNMWTWYFRHQRKLDTASGFIKTIESGSKHLLIKRFTFRYPEEKLKFVGDGYQFDPKRGVGIAGYRGRHILFHDKCTGCQLCAIACEGIAEAIGMVKVDEQWKQNKKAIMPQIDYGKCVFCGLCVDACPFYALYMTDDYELSAFTKEHLIYTPAQLGVKPKYDGQVQIKIDRLGANHRLPPPD